MPDALLETTLDRSLIAPMATMSLLYNQCPDYDPDEEPLADVILSMDDLRKHDLTIEGQKKSVATMYTEFLKALLGDTFDGHPLLDSIVLCRYKDEALSFVSRPKIAMVEGYPTLIIGAESKEKGKEVQTFKFTLDITPEGITIPGSAIKRLSLGSIDGERADKTRFKIPLACFNVNRTVYAVHIAVTPDCEFFDLQSAWEDKDGERLGELIATPYGANANLNSIFSKMMEAKAFPKDGIVVTLTGLTKTKVEGKGKGGGNFWKVQYNVDFSSFPAVNVAAYYDGESTDNCPLNMINLLSCYKDDVLGSVAFTDYADNNPPTPSNPWYLMIKGADPKRKTPIHAVSNDGTLGAKHLRIMEQQKSASFFPMPTLSPAIETKTI